MTGSKISWLWIGLLVICFVSLANALSLDFIAPTPTENVTGNSIYVNLSTSNGGHHYSFADFDSDLVLWMRMDDSNGTVFYDRSSYGNNGTVNGTLVTNDTNGVFGNGSRFNAASKIGIVSSSSLNSPGITDKITVCAWINIFSHGTGFKGIIGKWKLNERQYLLVKDSVTNKYGFLLSNNGLGHTSPNGASVLTDAVLNTSEWYHLCGTYNGSNIYVYLNSQKQSGTADSQGIFDAGSGSLEIGTFFQSFTYGFNGNIDEVMIFNRGLAEQEIKAIYNASAYQYGYNFTNLTNGGHTFTGYAVNKSGNVNSSTRIIFTGANASSENDTAVPSISFVSPTETSGSSITTRNNILVNVSASDTNLANITIYLYNSSGLVNSTIFLSSPGYANFSGLANGTYYFNATASDSYGNSNSTETRNVTINYSVSLSVFPALNLSFVSPTSSGNVTGNSIYVNLSTNGSERYSFVDFDSDLILWMRMDDEDFGTIVDKSSYGNDGTFVNGSYTSSGVYGNALILNGTNYLTIPNSSSLNSPGVTDEITLCAWFKTAQHGSTFRGLVGRYNTLSGNNDRQYLLAENSADNKYGIFLSSDGTTYQASVLTDSELNTNQWYHLCGTTNGTVSLYLDGVKQSGTATLANIKDSVNTAVLIGSFQRADANLNGSIDEVLVFNRGLSEQEIKAIYNASAYQYESNFTNLTNGSHTFTGYVVNKSASYLSTSRTVVVGNSSESNSTGVPNITFVGNTLFENSFNMEYELNVSNNPDGCFFSREGSSNVSMINEGNGLFSSSESLAPGIYNLSFYCNNSYGYANLSKTFTLRKSKIVHDTYYANSENLDIYFDFYFNYTSANGSLIIVPDSWSSSKDSYRDSVGDAFRDAGYSVVLVNTRGKGSSEGSRGAFLEECADIYEVIDEVRTNPAYSGYVSDRVYIWGFSAGGGRAGACSARYPDLFSGIFSTGGVLNVTNWWNLNSGYRADLEARIGGTPTTNPEGYLIRDASYLNYNALAPAMVTAYTADASVNVALSRNYNASMNYNENEIRYDEYAGGSHAIVGLDDSVLYFANHTQIYSIPSQGDFIIGSLLKTKNFSINLNNVSFRGFVNYSLFNSSYQTFNITTLDYSANATISLYSLNSSQNYSINYSGNLNVISSDSNGDLEFNASLANNLSTLIIVQSIVSAYCGDSVCNNGESCSSCSSDCGTCSSGSTGGGGGGGSSPKVVNNTNVSSSFSAANKGVEMGDIGDIIAHLGDERVLEVSIQNNNPKALNKCKVVAENGYESWVVSAAPRTISSGEIVDLVFSLVIPKDAVSDNFPKIYLECLEESINIPLTIVLLDADYRLSDLEILFESKHKIVLKFKMGGASSGTVSLGFAVFDSDGERFVQRRETFEVSEEVSEKEVSIDILGVKKGIIKVEILDGNKVVSEESLIYQPSMLTGMFSFSTEFKNNPMYAILGFFVLVLIFFFVIRINYLLHRSKLKKEKIKK